MDENTHMKTKETISFGENVRALRKAAGLSQEELGHRADLHRTYIGGVERGERNISLINIVALARTLQCDPELLLKGVCDDSPKRCSK